MQATAAEMLRIACILIHERGIQLCAPVHDAVLIEAPDELINLQAKTAQDCMIKASEIVLGGFQISTDIQVLTYPERLLDQDSQSFWDQVMDLMAQSKARSHEISNTNMSKILTPVHSLSSY